MPPIPQPAGTVQIVVALAGPDGVSANNVLHAQTNAPYANADLQALANAVQTQYTATTANRSYLNSMAGSWSVVETTVADLEGNPAVASAGQAVSNVHNGTNGGAGGGIAALSPNVAYVISWRIQRRYRGGHPRTYLAGLAANATDVAGGREINSGNHTGLVAWASDLLAAVNDLTPSGGATDSWHLGSVQRVQEKAQLNPPIFWPFQSASADLRLDSMRRRLGRPV